MQSMFSSVHFDVWSPAPFVGGNGFRYFVIFVDECTRMTWIYFLRHKSEVFDKFASFFKLVQTQFHTNIKTLRSDNGREFVNSTMTQFCKEKGVIHQTSCAYTPERWNHLTSCGDRRTSRGGPPPEHNFQRDVLIFFEFSPRQASTLNFSRYVFFLVVHSRPYRLYKLILHFVVNKFRGMKWWTVSLGFCFGIFFLL